MKAKEKTFSIGRLGGGITFYPYQFTIGLSVRYWPCIFAPSLRLHLICFKFWIYWQLKLEQRQETASAVDTIVSVLENRKRYWHDRARNMIAGEGPQDLDDFEEIDDANHMYGVYIDVVSDIKKAH